MADHPDHFNLFDDTVRECPFPYFASIRNTQPVYFMQEINAWYVSRYEDIRYVKKHPELFSNNLHVLAAERGRPRTVAEEYRREHGWERVSTLQRTDPPVHGTYRKLINHAFTVKRIRQMTSYVETVVNDLIDQWIDRGEVDFVWDFAVPLPCIVIADQLGVPRERIWDLKRWSDAMLAPTGGMVDEKQALDCAREVVEAQQFFASVIQARRDNPQDDIITDLAHAQIADPEDGHERPLTMYELMDLLDQLLTGGNETTTNALGSAMMMLLNHPEQMQAVQADSSLIRNFLEESLRMETPVLHLWRVATQDTEIAGVKIPAGSSVALGYASANRDEAVFPDAEQYDVCRHKAGAHLAFGSGPHHCPGAALARQEMYSAFTIVLKRLKNIRLANPQDRFEHEPSSFLRGLKHLHLTFDIQHRERYEPEASVY